MGIDGGERGASGKDGAHRDPAGTGSSTEASHALCAVRVCVLLLCGTRWQECVVGASM